MAPIIFNLLVWLIYLCATNLPLLLPSSPQQIPLHPTRALTLCTWLPSSSPHLCFADPHKDIPPCESSLYPTWAPTCYGGQLTYTVPLLTSLALCPTTPYCPWTDSLLTLLRFCHPALGSPSAHSHTTPHSSWAQTSCMATSPPSSIADTYLSWAH